MQTKTQTSAKGGAPRAAKQAPTQSAPAAKPPAANEKSIDPNSLRILLSASGVSDPLWFLPDGRLFLWTGTLADAPRPLSFNNARAWYNLYRGAKPSFAAPILPDDSVGRQLVDMVDREFWSAELERKTARATPIPMDARGAPAAAADKSPAPASVAGGESSPDLLNPAMAALRTIDALALLRCKANEAGAMALLLADGMKMRIDEDAGWEDFAGVPGFEDGLHGLARSAAFRLSGSVSEWERNLQPMIARLQTEKSLVRPARLSYEAANALLAAAGIDCPADSTDWLEDSVYAMQETILLPAKAIDHRNQSSYFAASFAVDELEKAFKKFWGAKVDLRMAAIALVASRGEGQRLAA